MPPRSRAPSSHVLGRSAWPPSRAIGVAAAAEPPALAVSGPRTCQGGRGKPGVAEGLRFGSGADSLYSVSRPRLLDSLWLDPRVRMLRLGAGREARLGTH